MFIYILKNNYLLKSIHWVKFFLDNKILYCCSMQQTERRSRCIRNQFALTRWQATKCKLHRRDRLNSCFETGDLHVCMYVRVPAATAPGCTAAYRLYNKYTLVLSGLSGLEVACWPLEPKFAGSNPAEAVRFFGAKKSSARLTSEGK
jgi:hypothetical protein